MGILDLIFPKVCIDCKKGNNYFCNNCLKKVAAINYLDEDTGVFSVFKYEGIIRKGIVKIKYNFAFDLAEELANQVVSEIKLSSNLRLKNAILIPIPLHISRHNWRGFNQSEVLGRLIAKSLNWEFNNSILTCKLGGKPQVGLKGIDRVRNIRGKFAVNPGAKLYQNTTYIVFDDVLTTGSTMKEAIKVIKQTGVNNVIGLTVAK